MRGHSSFSACGVKTWASSRMSWALIILEFGASQIFHYHYLLQVAFSPTFHAYFYATWPGTSPLSRQLLFGFYTIIVVLTE